MAILDCSSNFHLMLTQLASRLTKSAEYRVRVKPSMSHHKDHVIARLAPATCQSAATLCQSLVSRGQGTNQLVEHTKI